MNNLSVPEWAKGRVKHPDERSSSKTMSLADSGRTWKSLICICQGHSSLDAPSELNPPQRIPSLFWTPLVPQAEG